MQCARRQPRSFHWQRVASGPPDMPLLLTLAAIAAVLFIGAVSMWMRRTTDRLETIATALDTIARVAGSSAQTINNVASKVDPTALELAARKARRDARRARTARAA
jgi:hypothetical protein